MRIIKPFLLWTVSSSSNEDHKTLPVVDVISSSNEDYEKISVVDSQ
jgi:hypothetical protein